jgi:hypothetical protein
LQVTKLPFKLPLKDRRSALAMLEVALQVQGLLYNLLHVICETRLLVPFLVKHQGTHVTANCVKRRHSLAIAARNWLLGVRGCEVHMLVGNLKHRQLIPTEQDPIVDEIVKEESELCRHVVIRNNSELLCECGF